MYAETMVERPKERMKEAGFWKRLKEGKAQCRLCNRFCVIKEGRTGNCGVRKNISGKLISLVYGKTLALTVDPIEKKPLFHFRPGSACIGVSTYGCNFHCLHCQNYHISQIFDEKAIKGTPFISPEQIVEKTLREGVEGVAYTYTEPTIFAEYALDTMKLAKKRGLYNVWVSNGYMSRECADALVPFLDAINIDLKGPDKFYKEVVGNVLREKVLENIKYFHEKGVHVEVTNLIVPGHNDSEKDFREVSKFVHSIDPEMPLHFSRFFPHYKMDYLPPTDVEKINKAKEIAEKVGIKYVYRGNLAGEDNTYCKKCRNLLIRREMYNIGILGLKGNKCSKCNTKNNFII